MAYFTFRFAEKYAAAIFACAGGAALGLILSSSVQNVHAKPAGVIFGGLIGGYIGKQFNKYVKSIGTAIVGATMIVIGVSMYDPKMETEMPDAEDLQKV